MKADQAELSAQMRAEEAQRKEYLKNHRGSCVPWRGRFGALGDCIYCGKQVDAITSYYTDRAAGHHAAKAP